LSADTADAKNTGMNWRWAIVAAVVGGTLAGCVEREMTITSEPAGALVYVSDKEMGRTPVTFRFLWYGDYEVVLRHPGHKTLTASADITPPLYEIPPLDLLSEIAPWTYRDRRYLHYQLEALPSPATEEEAQRLDEELLQRAADMRQKNLEPPPK